MMESYEPALFYESLSESALLNDMQGEVNPIAKSQMNYVGTSDFFRSSHSSTEAGDLDVSILQTRANFLVLDISQKWELRFPLYAAHVFGEDLIPLFFANFLGAEDRRYLSQVFKKNDVDDLPDVHPIL